MIPALYLDRNLREFVREYLLELNLDKIKPDEHDLYFTLRRSTYRFRDVSVEERVKEAERIDKEKGHIRLQLITLEQKQVTKKIPAIKLIQNVKG